MCAKPHKHRESAHALILQRITTETLLQRPQHLSTFEDLRCQGTPLLPPPMPDRERQETAYPRRDTPDHRRTTLPGNPSIRCILSI